MSAFLPHTGNRCPVAADTMVRVRWACGHEARWTYPAGKLAWSQRGWDHDIAGYRVEGEGK